MEGKFILQETHRDFSLDVGEEVFLVAAVVVGALALGLEGTSSFSLSSASLTVDAARTSRSEWATRQWSFHWAIVGKLRGLPSSEQNLQRTCTCKGSYER